MRVAAGALSIRDACLARALALPQDACFSVFTAARLLRLPLPLTHQQSPVLHVSVRTGRRASQGRGTIGHQVDLDESEIVRYRGVRCTSVERTFCDLAATLSLGELVAIGDHLVRQGGEPMLRRLRGAVARYRGRRGLRRLRKAVGMLDGGAESPKESEARVLIIEAGMPHPVCNMNIRDDAGRFVARVDLAYPALKIAIEYEGDHHREKRQWRQDLARRRRLEALGWIVLSMTQADLDDSAGFFADLRIAIAARS